MIFAVSPCPLNISKCCLIKNENQRAENGGLDPSWLNLAFLGRPDFESRGPKILVLKGFGASGWKIGAPQKRQIQPRRIQPPILGPLRKISPQRKFLGRTSRGHPGVIRADIPTQNFGQGGQNPGKTSIWARISMTRRRGRPRP